MSRHELRTVSNRRWIIQCLLEERMPDLEGEGIRLMLWVHKDELKGVVG
jgi:hypothetical protein